MKSSCTVKEKNNNNKKSPGDVFLLTPAECTVHNDKIVTFNNWIIKAELPHSCNQVLAQDCSQELKFLVLLKRDEVQRQNLVNVKIADL